MQVFSTHRTLLCYNNNNGYTYWQAFRKCHTAETVIILLHVQLWNITEENGQINGDELVSKLIQGSMKG